jgi:hypothetical protein
MTTLYELLERMEDDGSLESLINNPLAQFGNQGQFLGATILPERLVPSNSYEESQIRFRSVIANSGERHSPAQRRSSGRMTGTFQVTTGSSDIASVFDARDHDAIVDLLGRNQDMEAAAFLSQWLNANIIFPLRTLVEKERWEALINAKVIRTGDNGYYREIDYPNPSGHRFDADNPWTDPSHDPFEDIFAGADQLRDKGYTVNRFICRSSTLRRLTRHPLVRSRMGNITVNAAGDAFAGFGATSAQVNGYLNGENLPSIETYDERYFTESAAYHFIGEGDFVMIATTDLDETVTGPAEDGDVYLPSVLGYTAIGRPSGETTAGRASVIEVSERKPRTITAEGWQETLPVITRPEAIVVIRNTHLVEPPPGDDDSGGDVDADGDADGDADTDGA